MKQKRNKNLCKKNNDECYTSTDDIYKELSQWAALDKFRGKNIICPCDWDVADYLHSIVITYMDHGTEILGNYIHIDHSKVIPTLWQEELPVIRLNLQEDDLEDFLSNTRICGFVKVLTQNAREWGIRSITASGYKPSEGKGIKFQEVDYSKYDICITNPPFSIYKDFSESIVGNIDFIVIAPFLNRGHYSVGGYLMFRQAYLGFGVSRRMTFNNPTHAGTISVNCDWITSFNEAQEIRDKNPPRSGCKYEGEYEVMQGMTMKDGTHPIRVGSADFPEDYEGWMFASLRILERISYKEYEWYLTHLPSYFNNNPNKNPFTHRISNEMYRRADGSTGFSGIVFRKKPQDSPQQP